MKARVRSALGTLLLLAAAGAALLWARHGLDEAGERERKDQESSERLFAFDAKEVQELVVEARGESTRLVRTEKGWRIPALDADADRAAADGVAERVAGARRKAEAAPAGADEKGLAGFGLARPRVRVEALLGGGRRERLELGDKSPFDGSIYARAGAGPVVALSGDVDWWLDKPQLDLRDRRLLPFEEADVARIEVVAPGLSYALARGDGKWRLASPREEAADEATVGRILGALRGLRATGYRPAGDDRALGLDRPRFAVRLVDPRGGERRLRAAEAPAAKGEAGPRPVNVRLDGRAEVASAAAGSLEELKVDLFALRDKTVLPFARDQVRALRVEEGGQVRLAAERAAGEGAERWTLTAPRTGPAAAGRVGGALYALSTLRAARFADESGASAPARGLAPAARAVVLLGEGGKELGRLEIGREEGERVYARSSASPRIVELEKSALALLPASPDDLEEKAAAGAPEKGKERD